MAKNENQTTQNNNSVAEFLDSVENEQRRSDALVLCKLMAKLSGEPAKMWGPAIIGFGSVHYKYDSGREGDMPRVGFSPRKQSLTLYVINGGESPSPLLKKLGKHTTSKACLYINKLSDVDTKVLEDIIKESLAITEQKYG